MSKKWADAYKATRRHFEALAAEEMKKYKKAQKEFNKILEEVKARKAAEKAEKEESKRNVHFTPGSKSVYKNFSMPRRLIITT